MTTIREKIDAGRLAISRRYSSDGAYRAVTAQLSGADVLLQIRDMHGRGLVKYLIELPDGGELPEGYERIDPRDPAHSEAIDLYYASQED
jgi:hypothetical protein